MSIMYPPRPNVNSSQPDLDLQGGLISVLFDRSPLYVATVSEGMALDVGLELRAFVRQLQADWPESRDDIAIWRHDGERVRLVGYLRPSSAGLQVTWL